MPISQRYLPLVFRLFFFATLTLGLHAQETEAARTLNAAAIKAYQAKDYASFLANAKRALALEPANPRLAYNVACGYALNGNVAGAIDKLDEILARKLDLGAEIDDDFAGIHKTPEWSAYLGRLQSLRQPLVRSTLAFSLPDPELVAAGIAIDPRNGDTYIASVRERKIVRRTRNGAVSDFVKEGQDGFLGGASLLIDVSRGVLYASTSAAPFMRSFRKEDDGRAGVYAFSLKKGKLRRKAMLDDGKKHFLNALALDRAGNLYVSDSLASGIYRLKPGANQLETFVASGVFRSTQGLAFSDDEKTLYVADFTNGVWALDMATLAKRRLDAPTNTWLAGLDGLTKVPGGFLSVQIMVKPERVLRLKLDPAGQSFASVDVLESNHPDFAGPVQGTIDAGGFYYIPNSNLNLVNAEGAFQADKAKPTVVLRLPIE